MPIFEVIREAIRASKTAPATDYRQMSMITIRAARKKEQKIHTIPTVAPVNLTRKNALVQVPSSEDLNALPNT